MGGRGGFRTLLLAASLTILAPAVLTSLVATAPVAVAAEGPDRYAADRVLVVGVPGLTWTDLAPDRTPELWDLAGDAPIGALSVRAARPITCILDGWATLGAGNRARYPGPEDALLPVPLPAVPEQGGGQTGTDDGGDGSVGPSSLCDRQQLIARLGLSDPEQSVRRIAQDEGTVRFGAQPGALGSAVGCGTALGRAAALAVAAPGLDPVIHDQLPREDAELAAVVADCPVTVVSLDGLIGTASLGPEPTDPGVSERTVSPERAAGLVVVDGAVGRIRAVADQLPGDTLLLLQGLSEVDDARPRLHVVIAAGPGFDHPGWLTSASTGRVPFAQLIDVAPTVLRALGIEAPSSMNGRPLRIGGERPALAEAVVELERANTAARVHYRSTGLLFWTLVVAIAAVVGAGVLVLGRRAEVRRSVPEGRRRALRLGALAVASLPVATYLANLAPWEAAGSPRLALLVAVGAAEAAVLTLAVAGPWRRRPLGPPLAVLAGTAATLVADVLTGSPLELDALLGYDAIVAGRFTGFGNLSFGLLSVSMLLVTAAVATAVGRRVDPARRRSAVAGVVGSIGVATVGLVGAPALGRDFGGVLALLPGFVLLGMLVTGVRVTVARLVLVLGAAVVAVSALAVLDWRGPPEDRSHLGRFVEQVLSGDAWTVVLRKAQANLDIVLGSALVWTLPTALLAALWLVGPRGLLRGRAGGPGGLTADDVLPLRAGLLASALTLALGAAVNDSGVAVPAIAAALLVPLLVWLVAGPGSGGAGTGEGAGGRPRAGPGEPTGRVTVVSRGSTVAGT